MAPSKPRNAAPSSAHTVVDTVDCLLHQSSVETYKYPRSLRFLFYLLATQWQCFGGGGRTSRAYVACESLKKSRTRCCGDRWVASCHLTFSPHPRSLYLLEPTLMSHSFCSSIYDLLWLSKVKQTRNFAR